MLIEIKRDDPDHVFDQINSWDELLCFLGGFEEVTESFPGEGIPARYILINQEQYSSQAAMAMRSISAVSTNVGDNTALRSLLSEKMNSVTSRMKSLLSSSNRVVIPDRSATKMRNLDESKLRTIIDSIKHIMQNRLEQKINALQSSASSARMMSSQAYLSTAPFVVPSYLQFQPVEGVVDSNDNRTNGLLIYDKTYITDDSLYTRHARYIERAYYYDSRGRVVQTVEKNQFDNISRISIKYDFVGNILKQHESHQTPANVAPDILVKIFTYDRMSRMLSESTTLSNGGHTSPEAKVTYEYDELGKLKNTTIGSGNTVLTTTNSYNIQGWLTRSSSPHFSMNLRYYNPQKAASSFVGNIAEWDWTNGAENTPLMYAFTYDPLSRLRETNQYEKTNDLWGDTPANTFAEKGMTYDFNGNIKSLQRYSCGTLTDDFTYAYSGNQLTGIQNGTNEIASQVYDPNGNLRESELDSVEFRYNYLNLTSIVSNMHDKMNRSYYTYSTDGAKLSMKDATLKNGFEYLGSMVYKRVNGELSRESATFGAGRIIVSTSTSGMTYDPNYFLSDHLGSVRTVVNSAGIVLSQNDYYAYGGRWNNASGQISDNRYLYNGKELQTTGDFGLLDYGARMYNHKLGRWTGMDLLSEKYYSVSPYAYCLNNPIKYLDPDGKVIRDAKGHQMWKDNDWTSYANSSQGRFLRDRLEEMRSTPTGMERFQNAANSTRNILIGFDRLDNGVYGQNINKVTTDGNILSSKITIDTNSNKGKATDNNVTIGQAIASTLGHELRHTEDVNITMQKETSKMKPLPRYEDRKEEKDAKNIGNKIINEFKNSQRYENNNNNNSFWDRFVSWFDFGSN